MGTDDPLRVRQQEPEQIPRPPAPVRGPAGSTRPLQAPRLVAAEDRPARVYLARLAPTGRRVQATALSQIADLLSGGSAEDLHRATDLPAVRGDRPPAGRHLSSAEIAAVLAGCPDTVGGRRDAALIAVLYGTGVRRSEAVALDLADVDLAAASVRVRSGKGGKHRVVFLPAGAAAALRAWLAVRGDAPGPLLWPVRRGGHPVLGRRLTAAAVGYVLARCADAAGVARFRAHDLRRTAVGDLLDAGADLATVARICGHAGPGTTARYDRRPEQATQHAAGLLHVPFTDPSAADA